MGKFILLSDPGRGEPQPQPTPEEVEANDAVVERRSRRFLSMTPSTVVCCPHGDNRQREERHIKIVGWNLPTAISISWFCIGINHDDKRTPEQIKRSTQRHKARCQYLYRIVDKEAHWKGNRESCHDG